MAVFGRKGVKRKKATKTFHPPQSATRPIEEPRTNTQDIAQATLRNSAQRIIRTDHGKPGTFAPKDNKNFS